MNLKYMGLLNVILFSPLTQAVNIDPVDQHVAVILDLNKGNLHRKKHFIWHELSGGEHDQYLYRTTHWVCLNRSYTIYGACSTTGTFQSPAPSVIKLIFTEKRTRKKIDLNLYAYNRPTYCGQNFILGMNSTANHWCDEGFYSKGKALTLWITDDEIAKLPIGGIWQANLKLLQAIEDIVSGEFRNVASWSADITLNLHDINNITIWFPQFKTSTPRVDLQLHTLPTPATPGGTMSGKALLDMCLYDGFNANSSSYQVTLSDGQNISGRDSQDFSVFRDGLPDAARRKRVDYRIQLSYNGQLHTLENNQTLTLSGINQAMIRPVKLPKIPQAVMCVPTPLTFITPTFNQMDKESGSYSGQVRMVFTPSL